jgi:enamine deaminase RidA (YjgF/YER057c/UK114 family)
VSVHTCKEDRDVKTGSKPDRSRRTFLAAAALPLALGVPVAAAAQAPGAGGMTKRVFRKPPPDPPPYSSEVAYGNLVFISGKGVGAGFKGDITAQVARTLDNVEESLMAAGSSMAKVLKVNVYLNNIKDFAAMNAVYRTRFPGDAPVRTTIGGVDMPDGGLVEIDCIGYI